MWMDEKTIELKEKITGLSDEELLNIVEVEFNDYRKEAIDFAKNELARRGIEFDEPGKEEAQPEQTANVPVDTSWVGTCIRCGGKNRPGVLVEDREITIYLTDNDEHRFIKVYACSRCGYVQQAVDFDNEVEN